MFIRKHLSYANVAATMALVFAMGGTAAAATHYLITSTRQIKPSVLKTLEASIAKKVKPGAPGTNGSNGLNGTDGTDGLNGTNGLNGQDLTSHTPLPSGKSESGWFAVGSGASTSGVAGEGISFSQPLSAGLTAGHAVFNASGTTSTHCPGFGKAEPGYLCLYAAEQNALTYEHTLNFPQEIGGYQDNATGLYGFTLYFSVTATEGYVDGSWTVTAP